MRKVLPIILLLSGLSSSRLLAQEADTVLMIKLKEVQVTDTRKWQNDTARYHFNQTRYYVETILPYLNAATKVFEDIDQAVSSDASRKEKKRLVGAKEDELRVQFEDKVKTLNETQGVLLIKLIARQTGVNIYSILQEFKNPLTAIKWQAWARMNGFNLNKKYNPKEEVLLEQVMLSLGYDLPDFYEHKETATALHR
jgi:hypothetical protein